ncbi:Holliday junction branch migration DNA helicase RuvB [Mycoplasma sp. NEAQ87857]|uniref:Holliday junction branch migration DNA helicase RuvB n=1 Tax=Mycoplasma sp. NEAQ87857 TaxID=2683967 RepID=UPI0013186704|nr:Holliday junction branch migration DNA helicase RuvB [Mycoplasma sp. NEAQ87857]QGZ97841.1 Holliday junction branch migration DNA helicase RuvB [Mycoplasma sp. NEAQ87857]
MLLENRPQNFHNFIGQKKLVLTLQAMIKSSIHRKVVLPHILLYGPPGMGKTTLATIIANESKQQIHYVQGSNIEKKADIINILSVINENDIVFIDEIHSINKNIVEFLYNAMEDFVFDLIIGVDGNSRAMRMKIKPFTLIGATTKLSEITQPLKDRFGYIGRLNSYSTEDIIKILINSAKVLKIPIENDYFNLIASYSRATPRLANHLLSRIYDFAISLNDSIINNKIIHKTFKLLDLYEYGLNKDHLEYLNILKGFKQKCVSLDTICGLISHTKETITNEIEPILLYLGLIQKNSRGRKINQNGIDYLSRQKYK